MRLAATASRDGHRAHAGAATRTRTSSRPPLFAVADGMGGAQAGEVASRLAAGALESEPAAPGGRAARSSSSCRRRTGGSSSARPRTPPPGDGHDDDGRPRRRAGGSIAFGHVGDSRAYRVRDGGLEQLTDDHSLVGELVRSGELSPEEAGAHPQRSVITRALGTEPDVDVDTFTVEAEPGDVFLLCSDGLTDMSARRDPGGTSTERRRPRPRPRALVDAANEGGGEDNITVVLF